MKAAVCECVYLFSQRRAFNLLLFRAHLHAKEAGYGLKSFLRFLLPFSTQTKRTCARHVTTFFAQFIAHQLFYDTSEPRSS